VKLTSSNPRRQSATSAHTNPITASRQTGQPNASKNSIRA
jgi:hypothetical protein